MSVQFGRWSFDGQPPNPGYLEKAGSLLAPYGPDGGDAYSAPGIDILYCAFHTTRESRREKQPDISPSGAVVTWDGRLDNREELIHQLNDRLSMESTDVAIVAAAYERWRAGCFSKLIGDWAISIWDPVNRSLILAKDFVGTRHLYYTIEKNQVTWSSILDPLVLLAGKSFALEEEYIAGWLSFSPATHLTPYAGIHSVSPSTFVRITPGQHTVQKHWDFDPGKRIRYRSDAEYEEHFRTVFAESVRRRLRSDTPVLAELSGGMDSSSVVCMADKIIAQGGAETPRLDTVSYYDDSEPNWNERPYFTKVEEMRGRAGCHVNMAENDVFPLQIENAEFAATPASIRRPSKAQTEFAECLASGGNRVILSGIGGDEMLGGVPTPIPELADLLVRARFTALARQLKHWALSQRRPWLHLLWETARGFLPIMTAGVPQDLRPVPWLRQDFARRHRGVLTAYASRLKVFGPLPSFQENLFTLGVLRRQLENFRAVSAPTYEKRYPYLDRDLLQFVFAVPRQQIIRAGERRSLMRRAVAGMVPRELLERKRKAFLSRSPLRAISRMIHDPQLAIEAAIGIIVPEKFTDELVKARNGREVGSVAIMRTFVLELWCRNQCRITKHSSQLRHFKWKGGEQNELREARNPVVL